VQQLFHLETSDRMIGDKMKDSLGRLSIPQYIQWNLKYKNGIEYSFVEVTCSDGTQYGPQAYGEEANQLYKEAYRCRMYGCTPIEPKRSAIV
jgi:hypothetical protein